MQNLSRTLAVHKATKGLSFLPRFHLVSQKETLLCLPFKLSVDDSYQKFCSDIKFYEVTPKTLKNRNLKIDKKRIHPKYIPFYGVEARYLKSSFAGSYGIDHTTYETETYYDQASKTTKTRQVSKTVTYWYPMKGTLNETYYPLWTPQTQVYAGFTYPRKIIEKALACNEVSNLEVMDEVKVVAAPIELHEMKIGYGLEKIHERIYDLEKQRAINHSQAVYGTSKIQINFLDVHTNLAQLEYQQFHLPAYLYESDHQDDVYLKVMNGYSGNIFGERKFNVMTVGFLSGVTGSVVSPFIYTICEHNDVVMTIDIATSTLSGASICWALGILAAKYYPVWMKKRYADDLTRDMSQHQQYKEKEDDPVLNGLKEQWQKGRESVCSKSKPVEVERKEEKIVKPSTKIEEPVEKLEEPIEKTIEYNVEGSETLKPSKVSRSEKSADKCKLLGLDPESHFSLTELKEAYNIQVNKWHPKVFNGDERIASAMTQQLRIAYEYLKTELSQGKLLSN